MMIGPDPMSRIFLISVRLGMESPRDCLFQRMHRFERVFYRGGGESQGTSAGPHSSSAGHGCCVDARRRGVIIGGAGNWEDADEEDDAGAAGVPGRARGARGLSWSSEADPRP